MTSSGTATKIYIAARFRVKEEVSHPSLLAWPRGSAFISSICWRESWQAWTCLWKNLKKWVGIARTLTKDNFSRAFQRWLESWKLVFVLVMELSKKGIKYISCYFLCFNFICILYVFSPWTQLIFVLPDEADYKVIEECLYCTVW